ncbi:MAG: hypothetical protein Q9201_006106 [Fulgogasparrea decipioides]
MSGRSGQSESEVLFCHQCENEWRGSATDLQCPRCDSEFVEVVEHQHDPREDRVAADEPEAHPDRLPHNPLFHMNPWVRDRPGSDEGNIEHVEWNPSPGIHFSRTSYRSLSPNGGFPGQRGNDPLTSLFQSMLGDPRPGGPFSTPASPSHHQAPWQPHHPAFHEPHRHPHQPGYGGRNTFTATTRVWPSPTNQGNNHLQEIMRALFENIPQPPSPTGSNDPNGPRLGPGGFPGLHQFMASVLNPSNAAHGDFVYSQEALDRIISQFMDAHNGSSAPGPASAAAISALPKKAVTKEMLGSDGKAECSVCMDNVELGDEVTVLPCQHWFHGECVGAWLKEHDTCPHCRQGIMPKDGPPEQQAGTPRLPGQEPLNSQLPRLSTRPSYRSRQGSRSHGGSSPTMMFRSQLVGSPQTFRSQQDLPVPPRSERRRSSGSSGRNTREGSSSSGGGGGSGGGGISGAIGGWVSRHLGSGRSGSQDRSSSR